MNRNVAAEIVEEIISPGTTESTYSRSDEGKSNDEIKKCKCFDEARTLWVGDIPFDVNEDNIASIFSNFGDVEVSLKIGSLKYPTKYAFIQFSSIEIALDAFNKMNNQVVNLNLNSNKDTLKFELNLGSCKRNSTLHIGNLDASINEKTLESLFNVYGELNCEIGTNGVIIHRVNNTTSTDLNMKFMIYATISFVNREDADTAKESMNGTILGTRHIRVEWNRKRGRGSEVVPVSMYQEPRRNDIYNNHKEIISVYVQFESLEEQACKVNEAFLRTVFEPFGCLTGCYIKSSNYFDSKRQHGYAFVHFTSDLQGQYCARIAAETIGVDGNFLFDGVVLRSEVSRNYCKAVNNAVNNAINSSLNASMNDGYYYSDFNGHGPAYMNRSGGFNMMCNNNNNEQYCSYMKQGYGYGGYSPHPYYMYNNYQTPGFIQPELQQYPSQYNYYFPGYF